MILGGAGPGKTTVALHRIAALAFKNPSRFNQDSIAVIVPDEGLVRLSKNLLSLIGMRGIFVATFDHWVHAQGRNIIHGLPKRLCEDTPPRVIRFKRHPAMMIAVQVYLKEQAKDVLQRAAKAFPTIHEIKNFKIPNFSVEYPMKRWLAKLQKEMEKTLSRKKERVNLKG